MKNIKSILLIVAALINANVFSQEVIELKQPLSNKVVIKIMFRNGSICDPAGKEGLTALTATLMMEGGTGDMSASDIKDKLYPFAGRTSVSVDKEVSVFTFEAPADHLDDLSPILRGLMLAPSFVNDDFERIKSNQQNYVDELIRASSDEEYSKKSLEDFLFRGSNYQAMVQGTSRGVKSITIEDVSAHYKKYFTRTYATLGIAGNYPDSFRDMLKKNMTEFPESTFKFGEPGKVTMPQGINVEIISKDNALGSAIFMGYPININRGSDDFAALMVANSWFGEHRKSYSHLYHKIRAERSMNYGDYSYIEWYENGGSNMLPRPGVPRHLNYFSIWLRPVQTAIALKKQYTELNDIKTGHAHFAIRMALHELQELIDKGMSPEDFEATRDFLRSYIKLYIQTPSNQLGYLMDSRFYGRKDYIREMDDLLGILSIDEVNAAIKKHFQTSNMDITIITDKSEAEDLANSLRSNQISPMSYSNVLKSSLNAEILEYDKQVEAFKLNIAGVKLIESKNTFADAPVSIPGQTPKPVAVPADAEPVKEK
jgi:zinc protease